MKKKPSVWNVPNLLSLLRCLLVPVFVLVAFLMKDVPVWGQVVPAAIFLLTAFTDMLDGKIARKYNLVTTLGKVIDPLADKFMVFSALIVICILYTAVTPFFIWVTLVIIFRDLAVTSLRVAAAGNSGIVVAASFFGKAKTVSHVAGIVAVLLEPVILPGLVAEGITPISYVFGAIMTVTAVWSGIDYFRAYAVIFKDENA
jgi:CDP-diacylglycerol--glycerol-3-phosphate 3-phosphatidyltransferase